MPVSFNTKLYNTAPARPVQERTEPLTPEEKKQQAREDKLELSREAVEFLQQQSAPQKEEEKADQTADLLTPAQEKLNARMEKMNIALQAWEAMQRQSEQMKEQSEKQAEALKKAMDKMKKCMKIAKSIQKGNHVPPQDEKYLLENDPKTYMMAMVLRQLKEKPKKEKSVLDKDDLQGEKESSQAPEAVSGVEGGGADIGGGEISVEAAAAAE